MNAHSQPAPHERVNFGEPTLSDLLEAQDGPIARHELVKMLTGLFKGLNYSAPLKNVRRNVVNTLNNSRSRLNMGCPGEFSTVILCRDVLQAIDAFEP